MRLAVGLAVGLAAAVDIGSLLLHIGLLIGFVIGFVGLLMGSALWFVIAYLTRVEELVLIAILLNRPDPYTATR